ncbi:SMI1/KNR4 family protein [Massilia sp. BJB1822]|uniref:SMI1/KNR4 family protein n=1 Tax=Massilia sp. BJB1822 TaxID=2744470 RepID=UPI0015945BB6|nr:SMI1/KNR4 family protein [Massilia sp. BJB1822]NVE01908.1 SMI1/KNR4 family protein [Massilia sp. BJB1822]
MTLLTIEDIKQGLDLEFLPLEPLLNGFRLIAGGVSESEIEIAENNIKEGFPNDFKDMLKKFNFGNLTIGPIAFCNNGNYLKELIELNISNSWWGEGFRPPNLLLIANSDPYGILLNVKNNNVLALDPELGWKSAKLIAKDFEKYIRGIGTIMLRRSNSDKTNLAKEVLIDVGSNDSAYWLNLSK